MYDTQTNWIRYIAYFIGFFLSFSTISCNRENQKEREIEKWQQKMDEMANKQLDSIYKKQNLECDSLQKIRVPKIIDSLLKDTGYTKAGKQKVGG